jgi:hypothetical protein
MSDAVIKKIFGLKETTQQSFSAPGRQDPGILEDHSVRKSILAKEIVTDDHNSNGSLPQVVNVTYGTSATPPTASTVPIGTIYIQYTA